MTGCENHWSGKNISGMRFYADNFLSIKYKFVYSCPKFYFSAGFQNRMTDIFDNARQLICSDMRVGIGQYVE